MSAVEQGLQAQIRNIEATYGKPMSQWLAIIAASGLTKHAEVVGMLKADYGMTHGAAHRVSLVARQASAPPASASDAADPVSVLYTGKKAVVRPLHDALMTADHVVRDDIERFLRRATSARGTASSSRCCSPALPAGSTPGSPCPVSQLSSASRLPQDSTPCSRTGSG